MLGRPQACSDLVSAFLRLGLHLPMGLHWLWFPSSLFWSHPVTLPTRKTAPRPRPRALSLRWKPELLDLSWQFPAHEMPCPLLRDTAFLIIIICTPLFLPLFFPTHAHTHACKHACSHSHMQTFTHTCMCTQAHMHTHMQT